MRIKCPLCGDRDRREFYYKGSAVALDRPAPDAGEGPWQDYVYNRENLAGDVDDLWHHTQGCSAWIVVTRNATTHQVIATRLAKGDAS